ncbi:hypothetical protein SpCBS45565_g01225 [Spizellomyces sp. 'palustris']|nr:hypothetical protein SpCBS45565_g01225 [Spizellomyces sp. 'palustris']
MALKMKRRWTPTFLSAKLTPKIGASHSGPMLRTPLPSSLSSPTTTLALQSHLMSNPIFIGTLLSVSSYASLSPLHKLAPKKHVLGTTTRKIPVRLTITPTQTTEHELLSSGSTGKLLSQFDTDYLGFGLVRVSKEKGRWRFVLRDGVNGIQRVFEVACVAELSVWVRTLRSLPGLSVSESIHSEHCGSTVVDRPSEEVALAAEPLTPTPHPPRIPPPTYTTLRTRASKVKTAVNVQRIENKYALDRLESLLNRVEVVREELKSVRGRFAI